MLKIIFLSITFYLLNVVYSSNEVILAKAGYNYVGNLTILDTRYNLIVSSTLNIIYLYSYLYIYIFIYIFIID